MSRDAQIKTYHKSTRATKKCKNHRRIPLLDNSPCQITVLALEAFLDQQDGQAGIPPLVGPSVVGIAIVVGAKDDGLGHLHDAPVLGTGILQTAERVGLEGGVAEARLLLAADGAGGEPGLEGLGAAQDGWVGGGGCFGRRAGAGRKIRGPSPCIINRNQSCAGVNTASWNSLDACIAFPFALCRLL